MMIGVFQGDNNTLSSPSYYIVEDAVVRLGDKDCKLRNGHLTTEGNLSLDTSVACDSCDLWYHSFCVGFDPNGSYGSSWLCPKCNAAETLETSDTVSNQKLNKDCIPKVISSLCPMEMPLSGKLTASVVDAGETTIVDSLIEGRQLTDDDQNIASEISSNGFEESRMKDFVDAVNDGVLETSGKGNPVDLKLLTTFRATIVKPREEQDKRAFASLATTKRSLLQKGKMFENLTRKSYGTADGQRPVCMGPQLGP